MAADSLIVDLTSSDDDADGERCELVCISSSGSVSATGAAEWPVAAGMDDDDVFILDGRPCPKRARRTLVRAAESHSRTKEGEDAADLDCCIVELETDHNLWKRQCFADDAEDVVITGEIGHVACRDFPHSRHVCAQFPFKTTPHENHCLQCHCYVCDQQAPCLLWGRGMNANDHCHASDGEDKWRLLRESIRNNRAIPSAARPATTKVKQPSMRLPSVITFPHGALSSSIPPVSHSLTYPAVTTSNCGIGSASVLSPPQNRSNVIPSVRVRQIQSVQNSVPPRVIMRPKLPFPVYRPHQALPQKNHLSRKSKSNYMEQAGHLQPWPHDMSSRMRPNFNFSAPFSNSSTSPCSSAVQNAATLVARENLLFQSSGTPLSSQVPVMQSPDLMGNSFPVANALGLGKSEASNKDLSLVTDSSLTGSGSEITSVTPDSVLTYSTLACTSSMPIISNGNTVALPASYEMRSTSPMENLSKISQPQSDVSWTPSLASVISPEDVGWVDDLLGSSHPLSSVQEGQPTMFGDFLAQLRADDDLWDFEFPAEILGQL
ncbi:hypothetical protein O6H91_07G089200 [Diphasiastrum complanatum]|uniref:Uncharacterized protein n=1 Tax=Diphasiastrum complanatum TaxID=34168 RepID=A0ACC2D7I3_DIPCM|nr:hypothetical protein O6H91_07G089200 [Diphasiastrum complanatum]